MLDMEGVGGECVMAKDWKQAVGSVESAKRARDKENRQKREIEIIQNTRDSFGGEDQSHHSARSTSTQGDHASFHA